MAKIIVDSDNYQFDTSIMNKSKPLDYLVKQIKAEADSYEEINNPEHWYTINNPYNNVLKMIEDYCKDI